MATQSITLHGLLPNVNGLREGEVVAISCKAVRTKRRGIVLCPVGRFTEQGLAVKARRAGRTG